MLRVLCRAEQATSIRDRHRDHCALTRGMMSRATSMPASLVCHHPRLIRDRCAEGVQPGRHTSPAHPPQRRCQLAIAAHVTGLERQAAVLRIRGHQLRQGVPC